MKTSTIIRKTIHMINAEKYDYQANRNDQEFIADVSQHLNDNHDINLADSHHAHNVFCEELDEYFA